MSLFDQLQDRFRDATILPDELAEEYHNLTLPPIEETRPASVLVGFVDRPDPTLLLTRRQAHLRSHAGQVAFPGGRVDEGDRNAVATALRESWEEVALPPDAVRIIGTMPPFRTFSGFAITPVLGVIPPDLPLVPHEGEVARLFEGRCDILFNPAAREQRSIEFQGGTRSYWETMVDGERVWGVTAALIRIIGQALNLETAPDALNRTLHG